MKNEDKEDFERQKNKKSPEILFKNIVLDKINLNNPKTSDRYPNQLFWFDNEGIFICKYDKNYGEFQFNYHYWSLFANEVKWKKYDYLQKFLKKEIEKNIISDYVILLPPNDLTTDLIEKHFNSL